MLHYLNFTKGGKKLNWLDPRSKTYSGDMAAKAEEKQDKTSAADGLRMFYSTSAEVIVFGMQDRAIGIDLRDAGLPGDFQNKHMTIFWREHNGFNHADKVRMEKCRDEWIKNELEWVWAERVIHNHKMGTEHGHEETWTAARYMYVLQEPFLRRAVDSSRPSGQQKVMGTHVLLLN